MEVELQFIYFISVLLLQYLREFKYIDLFRQEKYYVFVKNANGNIWVIVLIK